MSKNQRMKKYLKFLESKIKGAPPRAAHFPSEPPAPRRDCCAVETHPRERERHFGERERASSRNSRKLEGRSPQERFERDIGAIDNVERIIRQLIRLIHVPARVERA